jgi:hypothetical protein
MIARLLIFVSLGLLVASQSGGGDTEIWMFNQTSATGGYPTRVLGHPQIIDTPFGKAVQFNGVSDALFIDDHPLAGATAWTWEVIFRPDADGNPEQRFFHLSVLDPATGKDTDDRMLFEIRIVDGQWCLDSFAQTGDQKLALLNRQKLYSAGKWYRVTAVYDGATLKNYVGDELQGQGPLRLAPQGPGHSSVGVRINLVNYFKGAIYESRFTRRALPVDEFLKLPPAAN